MKANEVEVFKVRSVPLSKLSGYYRPDEVLGYCKACPGYGRNWSCPPHAVDVETLFRTYRYACIIGAKVRLTDFNDRDDALAHYHTRRRILNERLLDIESDLSAAHVLFSGNCNLCRTCCRKDGRTCIQTDKMRYSLESLGYDVAGVCEAFLDYRLRWDRGQMPEHMVLIAAVLSWGTLNWGHILNIHFCKGEDLMLKM